MVTSPFRIVEQVNKIVLVLVAIGLPASLFCDLLKSSERRSRAQAEVSTCCPPMDTPGVHIVERGQRWLAATRRCQRRLIHAEVPQQRSMASADHSQSCWWFSSLGDHDTGRRIRAPTGTLDA